MFEKIISHFRKVTQVKSIKLFLGKEKKICVINYLKHKLTRVNYKLFVSSFSDPKVCFLLIIFRISIFLTAFYIHI